VQHDVRFAGFLAADFDVLPAQVRADAGAKGLGDRLLARENARPETAPALCATGNRPVRTDAESASGNGRQTAGGRFDALHFDDVNAGAENHNRGLGFQKLSKFNISFAAAPMRSSISRTAVARPTTSARLMMLWPMFNSTRCGTCRSTARF
jgi:hypothetical protein